MANFANPTVGSNYTDFPTEIRASVDAALQMLSVGSHTNIPNGAIKWDASAKRFVKYNGSSFENLTDEFLLDANVNLNRADFGDNDRARFGNSQQLQIYYGGANAFIDASGASQDLIIKADDFLIKGSNDETLFKAIENGSCELYENNVKRFETNSNGATVTGILTATSTIFAQGGALSLTRAGNTNQIEVGSGQTGNHFAFIDFIGDATYSDFGLRLIRGQSGNQGPNTTSQLVHRGTGILSLITQDEGAFTIKTNNTNRIFVHQNNGRVGISTTTPQVLLDAGGASGGGLAGLNNAVLYAGLTNNTNFGGVFLGSGSNGNTPFIAASKKSDGTALSLDLITSASTRMRILSTGSIGIDTLSPQVKLDVGGSSSGGIASLNNPVFYAGLTNNTNFGGVVLGSGSNGNVPFVASSKLSNGNNLPLDIMTGATSRMRITNTGDIGIGTTTPSGILHIQKSGTSENLLVLESDLGSITNRTLIIASPTSDSGSEPFRILTANSLQFLIDAVSRLLIDSSGKVGLSTTSPKAQLDVSRLGGVWSGPNPIAGTTIFAHSGTTNASSPSYLNLAAGNTALSGIHFGDTDDIDVGIFQYTHTDNAFQWRTNGGGVDMVLDVNGRVGLGLTNPDTDLVIQKTSPSLKLTSTSTVGNTNLYFGDTSNNTQGQIQFHNNGDFFRIYIGGSERVRLTSTGSLGIGVTAPTTELHIQTTSLNTSSLTTTNCNQLGLRVFAGGAANTTGDIQSGISLGEGRAGLYAYDNGGGAANGLGFWTGSNSGVSEKVRIQSDGKVGIATNSPQVQLDVGGVTSTGLGGLSNSTFYTGFTNNTNFGGVVLGSGVNGNTPFIAASKKSDGTGLSLAFFASGLEAFRINHDGLRIGQTSSDTAGQDNTTVGASIEKTGRISSSTSGTVTGINVNTNTTSNSKHYLSFRRSGTQIGSVTQNGASNVQFNVSSDRRLKENITDLKDALTNLLKLKPRRFNFIADETKQTVDGLIAQEVEETGVCTNAVWKDKDNKEMMQIDYSKFMTLAIASIQELAAKVSDLESKLA